MYGTGIDWPISYDELEPYYSLADWELGVSGSHHPSLPPRSRDYPNPGFPPSIDDTFWMPVADRLGISVYPDAHTPSIRGRTAAALSVVAFADCEVCPSGARYSADFHVAEAERSGLCEVFSEYRGSQDRAELGRAPSAPCTSRRSTGRNARYRARIMSLPPMRSNRLGCCCSSNCGNHSDQVGRNFMEHIYVTAGGMRPDRRFYPRRVGYQVLESLAYYTGADRRERGGVKLEFVFDDWDPLERHGRPRGCGARRWPDTIRRTSATGSVSRLRRSSSPNPDSRVSLDPDGSRPVRRPGAAPQLGVTATSIVAPSSGRATSCRSS